MNPLGQCEGVWGGITDLLSVLSGGPSFSSTVGFEMTELDLNKKNRRRSPRSRGTLVSSIVEGQGVNGQCF